jgi:DNA-binding PadR family transcriptional regulator
MSSQITRLMVLGVIAYRQPISGYGIQKTLDEWAVARWTTIAPASIYQQLRTLTSRGFIEAVNGSGGRAAAVECTSAGQAELRALLLALLNEHDFQPLSLIPLLHFTPSLSIEELERGLSARIAAIDAALGKEEELVARSAALGRSHVAEIFRLTWHGLRADRAWCEEFRQRLVSQPEVVD